MPSDWSFYADHPVKSSVIKRILPCSLHENQDGKDAGQSIEAVLVKETTLELVLFDVAKSRWKSLLEQPLFGVIKDCGVVNRNSGTDLLACVSDSGYLSFVHVLDAEVEDILRPLRFETVHQVEIAAPGSGYGELGHHLAIDHLSRALAVTSLRGAIEVWLLEDGLPVIEDEESRGTLFKVNEKGTIWEAIFIETSADATPLLSLVTIIDSNAFIVVYECGFAGLKRSYQVALPSDCIPVKVIPLNISHCFLAATETQLIFVDVRDPSHPSITRCQMPTERKDGETETPLVSSLRQSNLNTSSGLRYIYATFDNGDLGVLEYLLGSDTIQLVCLLNRNPISDLAILITGQASEVLGLLGDMCDGEIVRVDFSSNEVVSTGIIQNCAPVLDFKLADLGNNEFSIFSTIGHGSKGCVKEIRRGINVEPRLSIDEFYASAMSGLWTVSYDEKKNLNIVILSFICETRVLMIEDEELYDVSDSTGFDLGQTTLFAGSFSSDGLFLLQVTNQSVLVTFSPNLTGSDGSTYKQRWQPDDDSILLATQYMDCIALSLSKSREIVILKVLADGSLPSAMIAATTRIQVSEDLSCLHPITYSSHYGSAIGLVVGGYSSSVKLLDLNSADHNAVIWEDSLASQSFLSFPPNSVFLLPLWDKDLLFIGSRDGTLFVYESSGGDTGQSKPLFVKKQEVKLGTTPLFLLEYDASGVMCLGEKPCLITASENNIRIGPLCSESITRGAALAPGSHDSVFALLFESKLVFAKISDKVDYNSRQIAVHETPRRVLYDQFLAKIIVACLINTPSGPTTAIKIVDPVTLAENLVESLEPGEICYSLAVWNVKEGKRYICVGTWGFKSGESDTVEGRILVFNLRPYEGKGKRTSGDSKFRMRKLGEFKFPAMVTTISPFMNSYLLVGAGSTLYQLKIDAATRTLVSGAHVTVASLIQSISTMRNKVYVGCTRSSVQMYVYETQTKSFRFLAGDRELRMTADCIPYGENLILGTDKYGDFYVLKDSFPLSEHRGEFTENCLDNEISFSLGEVVLRLHPGSLFRDFETKHLDMSVLDLPSVHGVGVLGSLFSFHPISKRLYKDFVALVELLSKFPNVKSLLGNDPLKYRSRQYQSAGVIDGDFVSSIWRLTRHEKETFVRLWTENGMKLDILQKLLKFCDPSYL